MECNSNDDLQLTLLNMAGNEVNVKVPSTSTVLSIRQAAASELGHRWPMIRLQVDGRELKNDELSLKLQSATVLLLVIPNREEAVQHAKLAQMTERYDDMVQFCICFAQMGSEPLTQEQTQLFIGSFNSQADCLLASWQTYQHNENVEWHKGNDVYAGFSMEERLKREVKLKDLCLKFSEVLADHVIPGATPESSEVWQKRELELNGKMMTRMGMTEEEFSGMLQAPTLAAAAAPATAAAPTDVVFSSDAAHGPDLGAIQQITAMGFTADQAKNALTAADGDIETAVSLLVDQ